MGKTVDDDNDLSVPLLGPGDRPPVEKGDDPDDGVEVTAKAVAKVWVVIAFILLVAMSASHVWSDMVENSKEIFDDVQGQFGELFDAFLEVFDDEQNFGNWVYGDDDDDDSGSRPTELQQMPFGASVEDTFLVQVRTLDELHKFHQEEPLSVIHFHAPWASHSQALQPIYLDFGGEIQRRRWPMKVGAIDCTESEELCGDITAFPAIRFYTSGGKLVADYRGHRNVDALVSLSRELFEANNLAGLLPEEGREGRKDFERLDRTNDVVAGSDTATVVGASDWDEFRAANPNAFVVFYAPWCAHSQGMLPGWGVLAEEVSRLGLPVSIGKVDCQSESDFCRKQRIMAFPTIRWYGNESDVPLGYKEDRTVGAWLAFIKKQLADRIIFRPREDGVGMAAAEAAS